MSKLKIEIEVLALIILVVSVGIILGGFSSKTKNPVKIQVPGSKIAQQSVPALKLEEFSSSQPSPDGSKKLTMSVVTNKNFTKTYTFTSSNADGSDRKVAYALTLGKDTMTIPFNTWSPDNKYVFVVLKGQTTTEAIVARADGSLLTESDSMFNITDLYNARETGNTYDKTTGWASETLLIVNTKNTSNDKGPSYWFEVPSKAVIQLSTEF